LARWRVPIAIGVGLLYGLMTRLSWGYEPFQHFLGTPVSSSYLFLTPFVLGSLVALIGMLLAPSINISVWGVGMPFLAVIVGTVAATWTGLEAFFCVLVAFPILSAMAIMGGLITAGMMRVLGPIRTRFYASIVVFVPYLVAPVEQLFELPSEKISITNTIEVKASAETIWQEIASVDIWSPPELLSFSIEADPAFIPANAFDEHIIVGGRFYDVLDGTYQIEAISENHCRLHLTSHHRLSSNFNAYAAWWSRLIMEEIQITILEVVAKRAEVNS